MFRCQGQALFSSHTISQLNQLLYKERFMGALNRIQRRLEAPCTIKKEKNKQNPCRTRMERQELG